MANLFLTYICTQQNIVVDIPDEIKPILESKNAGDYDVLTIQDYNHYQ